MWIHTSSHSQAEVDTKKNKTMTEKINIKKFRKYHLMHRLPKTGFYGVCRKYADFLYLIPYYADSE
jgi:hypothetical protein